ncbi:MAG TPA: glycosyltransferase family 39 protein [Tepidisphaeraceae bacterium]|nr:glycosyltransferase family 39 protein [Tepidisphaeraceae bacterium]
MAKRIVRQSHKHRAVPPLPIHSVGESGRPAAVLTLAALGLLAWLAIGPGRGIGAVRWVLIAVAAASACIPAIANAIGRALDRIRQPSRKAMNRAAIVIALIAAGYFVLTAFNQDRDLFPKTHDDCSYAIGMQMLARGRLWMPALALPDFFDAFYILVRPVYCSLYFPGTALLYAPGVWLHLPIWLMPALASGAVVGVMYRIVAELIDGAAGMLAALMMVSLSWFRVYSVLITSHVPMLLLGLLMVLAWMRWRQRRAFRWAAAVGLLAGWAAITRPADAVIYALPVGIAMFWEIIKSRGEHYASRSRATATRVGQTFLSAVDSRLGEPHRTTGGDISARQSDRTPSDGRQECLPHQRLRAPQSATHPRPKAGLSTPLVIVLCAAPFLLLQLAFDVGVTGHPLAPPYGYYLERDQPGSAFGFHRYDPSAQPQSSLPEKHEYYDKWVRPYLRSHLPPNVPGLWGRTYFPMLVDTTMQCRLLLVFVPLGLLGLAGARRRVLCAALPLFVVIYAFNPFFLEHYALLIIPAIITLILLGGAALASGWPRFQRQIYAAFAAILLTVSITSLWEVNHLISPSPTAISDETFKSPYLRFVNTQLPQFVDQPAVVLFTYHPGRFFEEPVYNWDVATPNDAPIIRAHDLGDVRNREIFAYYARTQPSRTFYRCDFDPAKANDPAGPLKLQKLGKARDLASSPANP